MNKNILSYLKDTQGTELVCVNINFPVTYEEIIKNVELVLEENKGEIYIA